VLLTLAAALAIVVQDRTPLRAAPSQRATELTTLWQGEVLEVRDERAGYLKLCARPGTGTCSAAARELARAVGVS
jgi:hypothetical protein